MAHQFMEKGDTHTSPTRARVPSAPFFWAAPHSSLLMMPLRMSDNSSHPRACMAVSQNSMAIGSSQAQGAVPWCASQSTIEEQE